MGIRRATIDFVTRRGWQTILSRQEPVVESPEEGDIEREKRRNWSCPHSFEYEVSAMTTVYDPPVL